MYCDKSAAIPENTMNNNRFAHNRYYVQIGRGYKTFGKGNICSLYCQSRYISNWSNVTVYVTVMLLYFLYFFDLILFQFILLLFNCFISLLQFNMYSVSLFIALRQSNNLCDFHSVSSINESSTVSPTITS